MHVSVSKALELLRHSGQLFTEVFRHGSMTAEIYKPQRIDFQQPHNRDEMYVVISGHGEFYNGGQTVPFGPGDYLFVKTGVEHRFLNFSEDFCTWVFFYGPDGGEEEPPVF